MPLPPTLAVTVGEPAGIGPELCAMLAARHASSPLPARIVLIGDRALLDARARRIGLTPGYADYDPTRPTAAAGVVEVWNHALASPVTPGTPDPANARSVLHMLDVAADACATGGFGALVTAPMQKSVMMEAGLAFLGHTEYLAARSHTPPRSKWSAKSAAEAPPRCSSHSPASRWPSARSSSGNSA